ncbi:DNA repair protein RecO [Patescibacteria group bacterium]|nr:DNA repair protein RecO [Patescibacteria group bacterium]
MIDYHCNFFLLSSYDFSDFDKIINIYTDNFGKKVIRLKGAYKSQSKLNSHMQFFSLIEADIASGKNYDYICNVYLFKRFNLENNLKKNICFSFALEVLNSLTFYDLKEKSLYDLVVSYFEFIDKLNLKNEPFIDFKKDKKLIEFINLFFIKLTQILGISKNKKIYFSKEGFFKNISFYTENDIIVNKFFK